jgi:hypothetical protein
MTRISANDVSDWNISAKKSGKRRVKSYSKSPSFNRIYGKPQSSPKKGSKKRVFVKQ